MKNQVFQGFRGLQIDKLELVKPFIGMKQLWKKSEVYIRIKARWISMLAE